MTDEIDRAAKREAELLSDALRDQARRAGLVGKTVADSAHYCGEPIAQARREALPGCQFCVVCQARREKGKRP